MQPTVSIIVPVYKAERTLARCADSILSQTFTDFELLLVDDGSPDGSAALCDDYAKKDSRVHVIHKENGGVSSARNAGIHVANGKLTAFADSDDHLESDFLENAVVAMQTTNADWYISGFSEDIYENNTLVQSRPSRQASSRLYTVCTLLEAYNVDYECGITSVWGKLFRTELLRNGSITFAESMNYGEDTTFNLDYLEYCKHIYFDERRFYHYVRGNKESLDGSHVYHKDLLAVRKALNTHLLRLCTESGCNADCIALLQEKYAYELLGCIHQEYLFGRSKAEKKETVRAVSSDGIFSVLDLQSINRSMRLLYGLLRKKRLRTISLIFDIWYCIKGLKK